ncbi:hypothetical protein NXS19_002600 [Fusarium pseudograminearum]|nr:hypothetical protein NXS19_002600 [Fusarium pseudograminearum]
MEIITPQDYQNNSRKRQRRSLRPCDACRKRKTRCVTKDGDGDCVHCQLRATPCTFQHDPRPTGIQEEIGPDEMPGQLPNQSQNQNQPSVRSMSQQSRKESRDEVQSVYSVPSIQPFLSPAETRASADSGMPIAPPSVLVPELGPLDRTMGCSSTRFAELYGLGSDMEPILMRHRPYDPQTHEFSLDTHAIRRVLERDDGQEYPLTFHMAETRKQLTVIPPFPRSTPSRAAFAPMARASSSSSGDMFSRAIPSSPRTPSPLPIASPTVAYPRPYSEQSIYPRFAGGPMTLSSPSEVPRMLPYCAALLLLQCQPEDPLNPDHTFQWGLTCQALAIGQCLGLHLDASNWTIPQWERNVRKRLSWALFMQDRWTALAYGRPVHIHDDDWTVGDLTPADFSDFESEVPNAPSASGSVSSSVSVSGSDDDRRSIAYTGMTQYIKMVRLTQILSVVYSTFYTARTCREQDTMILFEKARPLFEMLTNWYHNIPPTLQMNVIYQRKLCFHGYLHFSYYGVVMTLLRRLMLYSPPATLFR